jgi:hypothetical protein
VLRVLRSLVVGARSRADSAIAGGEKWLLVLAREGIKVHNKVATNTLKKLYLDTNAKVMIDAEGGTGLHLRHRNQAM